MKISRTGHVYCLGLNEFSVSMWNIHEDVLQDHFHRGGIGLQPFCCLLPGGKSGWLFQELLDMFYYLQILAKGLDCKEFEISEYLPVTDLVDFMRGVSFFPSDFEIKNLMKEMDVLNKDKISFEELVKLYINHRTATGTRTDELEKAIYAFLKKFSGDYRIKQILTFPQPKDLHQEALVKILTEYGEIVDEKQALMCLKELCSDNVAEDVDAKKLPQQINIKEFVDNLLGLGLEGNQSGNC